MSIFLNAKISMHNDKILENFTNEKLRTPTSKTAHLVVHFKIFQGLRKFWDFWSAFENTAVLGFKQISGFSWCIWKCCSFQCL